jgi:hypothetical protein
VLPAAGQPRLTDHLGADPPALGDCPARAAAGGGLPSLRVFDLVRLADLAWVRPGSRYPCAGRR